jgi:DNA-binding transcriptional LysR family regulator
MEGPMKSVRGAASVGGLDLNLLHVFHVVYRERSVSQAARILAVSQSAVSHSLGRLRVRLGASLFEQQGRGLVPTAMADRLAPAVEAALRHLEVALADRRDFDPGRDVRRLVVAMPSQLEQLFLPPLVKKTSQVAPGIALHSVRFDRARMKQDLESGMLDVVVDASAPNDPELSSECLLEDTLCVVAANEIDRPMDLAAYTAARHVAVSSRRKGPSLVDILLIQQGLRRAIAVRCQRYEAACQIALSSDLLLTLGYTHASFLARAFPLHVLPVDFSLPSFRVHLYWPQRRDEDRAVLWLRTLLRDFASTLPRAAAPS